MLIDNRKKYYLAGPMSGIPKFNIPAFEEAANRLRDMGLIIVSPAELDSKEVYDAAIVSETGDKQEVVHIESWGDMLARDVKIIADELEGIILLPGWDASQGARLECFVSMTCNHPLYVYSEGTLKHMRYARAMDLIGMGMLGRT